MKNTMIVVTLMAVGLAFSTSGIALAATDNDARAESTVEEKRVVEHKSEEKMDSRADKASDSHKKAHHKHDRKHHKGHKHEHKHKKHDHKHHGKHHHKHHGKHHDKHNMNHHDKAGHTEKTSANDENVRDRDNSVVSGTPNDKFEGARESKEGQMSDRNYNN